MRYDNTQDAIDRLTRNGCRVHLDDDGLLHIKGEPGIKLLGAIDFLKKYFTVIVRRAG